MLFNVTLAIIAGFTAEAASVPYLPVYHLIQGIGYALLCYGQRLAIQSDSHLSTVFIEAQQDIK